jgi:hypothetical protein
VRVEGALDLTTSVAGNRAASLRSPHQAHFRSLHRYIGLRRCAPPASGSGSSRRGVPDPHVVSFILAFVELEYIVVPQSSQLQFANHDEKQNLRGFLSRLAQSNPRSPMD